MKELKLKEVCLKDKEKEATFQVASEVHCKITEDGDILSILENRVIDSVSRHEDDFIGFIYKPERIEYRLNKYGSESPFILEEEKFFIGLIGLSDARRLIRKGYKVLSSPLSSIKEDLEQGYKVVDL